MLYLGVERLSPAVFALSRLDGGWGETSQKWAWTEPYLAELAARLGEVELEASDGEIDRNLPLDTVKEGGEGGFQAEVRTRALYLSEESWRVYLHI